VFHSLTSSLLLAAALVAPPLRAQTAPLPNAPAPILSSLPDQPTPTIQSASTPSSEGITTLHTRTNLVVIDVVVTDSKQNAIHNLKASDFTLFENNVPQRVKNFEEHSSNAGPDTEFVVPTAKLPPGLYTNRVPAPPTGPVNIILLDSLNTPLETQPFVRQQLMDYLKRQQPGTRVAIFGLTSNLTMLQGFTSDPEVLKAALSKKASTYKASDLIANAVQGSPTTDTSFSNLFASAQDGSDLSGAQALANVQRFEALQTAFELGLRAKFTLNAFNLLARYLVGIPGRKNVIWFSAAFPLNISPNADLQDPFDSLVNNDTELRETDNLLTRAQIAVYPVDARGVYNTSAFTTDDFGNNKATDMQQFYQDAGNERMTMETMATDTGGHVFANTNNLAQAVQKAVENGSNYYTLSYSPSDVTWDGRFRTVKVVIDKNAHPGLSLTHRRGYYAIDPDDKHEFVANLAAVAPVHPTTLSTALLRGGPDPTEILFKLRVRPSALPPEENPAPGNNLNKDPKAKIAAVVLKGPFQRYGLDAVADPHAVACPVANTLHRCSIEFATAVYNPDGVLINSVTSTARVNLSAAGYEKLLKLGLPLHQEISVPLKGEYFIRTAIHDLDSDRIGAVEVPVDAVAKLPPLQAAATTPAPGVPAAPKPDDKTP
jgi:VWFA-related protein